MKRDMDSTAQHVASEVSDSPSSTVKARAAATSGQGGFKHHLLQVHVLGEGSQCVRGGAATA
jgi:hypothetical protein